MSEIAQYIESLIKNSGHSQSDIARSIGVPRQSISYIVGGKREISIPLALKLESFFNIPEGFLLKKQAEENMRRYKRELKNNLISQLFKVNAFWSYSDVSANNIPDDELIEKVFVYLDIKDIASLFELYPREFILKVWKEKMAVQGDYLFKLNVMIALFYFDIKQPEKYLKRIEREHMKHILDYA